MITTTATARERVGYQTRIISSVTQEENRTKSKYRPISSFYPGSVVGYTTTMEPTVTSVSTTIINPIATTMIPKVISVSTTTIIPTLTTMKVKVISFTTMTTNPTLVTMKPKVISTSTMLSNSSSTSSKKYLSNARYSTANGRRQEPSFVRYRDFRVSDMMLEDVDDTSDILSTLAAASTTNSTYISSIGIFSALGLSHRFKDEIDEEPESEVNINLFISNSDQS